MQIENQTPHRRLARPKAAAAYASIGISTLWSYAKILPDFPKPIKLGPRTTVFDLNQIDAYLAAKEVTA